MQRFNEISTTIYVFAHCQKKKNWNHIDCQNLQQNHFKSAMLLPSCAFVLRNVHLCQSFPRQSRKSANTQVLPTVSQWCQWLKDPCALSCYWRQYNLSDTAVSPCCSALCRILSWTCCNRQTAVCRRMWMYCAALTLSCDSSYKQWHKAKTHNIDDRYKFVEDLDQYIMLSSSRMVFVTIECCDPATTVQVYSVASFFAVFRVTIYI